MNVKWPSPGVERYFFILCFPISDQCPDGARFKKCTRRCERTCDNPYTRRKVCRDRCAPECLCPKGHVLLNKKCVLKEECPLRWCRNILVNIPSCSTFVISVFYVQWYYLWPVWYSGEIIRVLPVFVFSLKLCNWFANNCVS